MTRGSTELFDCARVSDYLESYLLSQVPPPERRGMRLHIHGCAACHRKVIERDPLQFFAPLADEERGASGAGGNAWDGFYDAIREGIVIDVARRRRALRKGWLSAAAVLVAAITVGLVASYVALNRARPVPAMRAAFSAGPLPQTVERVTGTGVGEVQVYTMNYYQDDTYAPSQGRGDYDTRGQTAELVLIVDAGLEL